MEILALPLFLIYPIKWFFPELLMLVVFLFSAFKIRPWRMTIPVMLIAPFVIYLIFRGDTHIKNMRWEEFCNSRDDFFKVHETVSLGREYWDEDGWPIFHNKRNKAFMPEIFDNRFEMGQLNRDSDDEIYSASGLRYIKDTTRDQYLITKEVYVRPYGWWRLFVNAQSTQKNDYCGSLEYPINEISGSSYNHWLTSWVFLPENELE